jgi:hypothetical protein
MPASDTVAAPGEGPEARPGVAVTRRKARPPRDPDSGRRARRQTSIHAYVGANGSGKSLAMVHDTLTTLAGVKWICRNPDHLHTQLDYADPATGEIGPKYEGLRRVLSTVRLIDAGTGEDHPLYERLTDWAQLLTAEHADVLFDEVVGIASSREHAGLPVQVQNLLVQLRKRDLVLRLTAPAFARMDKIIREVTQAVTLCRGLLGKRPEGALWRQSRLFWFKTYNAVDFEDFTADSSEKLSAIATAFMWGPRSLAFASYDTLGQVERVGEILDSGRCAHCGGKRSIPNCRCDATQRASAPARRPSPTFAVKQETPA